MALPNFPIAFGEGREHRRENVVGSIRMPRLYRRDPDICGPGPLTPCFSIRKSGGLLLGRLGNLHLGRSNILNLNCRCPIDLPFVAVEGHLALNLK